MTETPIYEALWLEYALAEAFADLRREVGEQ